MEGLSQHINDHKDRCTNLDTSECKFENVMIRYDINLFRTIKNKEYDKCLSNLTECKQNDSKFNYVIDSSVRFIEERKCIYDHKQNLKLFDTYTKMLNT